MRDTQAHEFATIFRFPVDAVRRSDIFTSQTVTTFLWSTTHELFLREAGFFVTLRHADTMPDVRIDAFLVVRDGGYSFLLGFVRESLGIGCGSTATSPAASRASCAIPAAWKSANGPPASSGAMPCRSSMRSIEDSR
ncbi:hypothetical protein [Burkholderia pseudomultivorans]|uniref:hypothetical protein n=1 Tax=Burkholderia pseudomultivorans TaxID=1207504 RepID=UPI0018900FEF|nr:hypothetical protein [Burkholderia pseudomultivorans]MBF5008635.1 hypothetical protein [Burkholderia pseudomultivorans]